jgi:hypothetical protein
MTIAQEFMFFAKQIGHAWLPSNTPKLLKFLFIWPDCGKWRRSGFTSSCPWFLLALGGVTSERCIAIRRIESPRRRVRGDEHHARHVRRFALTINVALNVALIGAPPRGRTLVVRCR